MAIHRLPHTMGFGLYVVVGLKSLGSPTRKGDPRSSSLIVSRFKAGPDTGGTFSEPVNDLACQHAMFFLQGGILLLLTWKILPLCQPRRRLNTERAFSTDLKVGCRLHVMLI